MFSQSEIELLKSVKEIFPESELIIYYATPEQVEQLKKDGLSGISRRQRK